MTNAKALQTNTRRRPGRPSADQSKKISREKILQQGLHEAINTPLQDLSIVTMAVKLDVTPALIHYYIGGRDYLTSGVMNLFYKKVLKSWPKRTGVWHIDLRAAATCLFDHLTKYGGISAYAAINSRFRVFQLLAEDEEDYGLLVLENITSTVKQCGLSWDRTGLYTNQLMDFIINISNGASRHLFPAEHRQFLEERTNALDPKKYPSLIAAKRMPLSLSAGVAFGLGLDLFQLGMLSELEGPTISEQVETALENLATKRSSVRA